MTADADSALDKYCRLIAERIHAASPGLIYEGAPPNPLQAVIVYQYGIDAFGQMTWSRLARSPGYPELEQIAAQSLRKALPFPPLPFELAARAPLLLSETWLFDYDDRFQVRSLAAPQQAPADDDSDEDDTDDDEYAKEGKSTSAGADDAPESGTNQS